jgi:hypothetical protein
LSGLLIRSEVSANWIAIRVVDLDYPSSAASEVAGVHAAIYVIIADCYPEVFLSTHSAVHQQFTAKKESLTIKAFLGD